MSNMINKLRENARHLFLVAACFFIVAGVYSCSDENSIAEPVSSQKMDDASLLKWQMEKFIKTKAADYNIVLVTTNTQFSFDEIRWCDNDERA